nr:cobalamin-dependent protein [Candidatus Omnitrophota bacterium]
MNVLLINPPWFVKKGNIWSNVRSALPPLGLLYLAAILEKNNIKVDVVDFQVTFTDWQRLEESVASWRYDWYGITTVTPTIYNAHRIAQLIKKRQPHANVVCGGAHVTALPEETLQLDYVDYIIRGDGEDAFFRLVAGQPLQDIAGLSYKEKGNIRHVGPNGLTRQLDAIPFPAFHKVDLRRYHPAAGSYKQLPAINMLTSRGCIGHCTFCSSAGIPLRIRSAENIFQEMVMLYERYGIREVAFYDDTFTAVNKNVDALCDLLIAKKLKLTWNCFARVDCVTLPLLRKMKQAGCHQLMYGIESADAQILQNISKHINLSKNKEAVANAKEAGIQVRCAFMFGNPGETKETIDTTIRYSIELDPDIAIYNITTPFPGSQMFSWAKEQGYLVHEQWDKYDLSDPVMRLPTITEETIKEKYAQAYRRFYFRPRFIAKKIKDIVLLRDVSAL